MLTTVFSILLISFNLWADEPKAINVIQKNKFSHNEFSKLEQTKIKAIDYHPNFEKDGPTEFQGYLATDILKKFKVSRGQQIVIVGKTGEFSLKLNSEELLGEDVMIATHKNGIELTEKSNGLQIIYGPKTIAKYPHLKYRQNWLWWVRAFVINDNYEMKSNAKTEKLRLKSPIPFPIPYGISSSTKTQAQAILSGKRLLVDVNDKIKITQVNGNESELMARKDLTYFLADNPADIGGHTLFELVEKDSEVQNILSKKFFILGLEVSR